MGVTDSVTRAVSLSLTRAALPGFSPRSLFAAGEQGAWYDPSDLSTLFQDSAGTTPVTAVGQPVGLMKDKSGRNNHASQSTTTARPLLQQDAGGRYYLSFDGVDDNLSCATGGIVTPDIFVITAINQPGTAVNGDVYGNKSVNSGYRLQANGAGAETLLVGSGTAFFGPQITLAGSTTGVLSGRYGGGNATIRLNGVDSTSAVTQAGGAAGFTMGKANDFAGTYYSGRLYGLIARGGTTTTTAQIVSAERYLAARSGVPMP